MKCIDLNSVERCLVLDLNPIYDLILGMAWFERHEPCISWRFKTLGATCIVSNEALESHEPTIAMKQKRNWRDLPTQAVSVLDIGVYEILDPHVNESSVNQCLETRSEAVSISLIDTHSDNDSLNAASIVGLEPGHQGLNLLMRVEWHI